MRLTIVLSDNSMLFCVTRLTKKCLLIFVFYVVTFPVDVYHLGKVTTHKYRKIYVTKLRGKQDVKYVIKTFPGLFMCVLVYSVCKKI